MTSRRAPKIIRWVSVRSASYCIRQMDTCRRSCSVPNDLRLLKATPAATPEEYAAAGSSYVAYSGRFFVDEGKKSLSHEMAVSFFPELGRTAAGAVGGAEWRTSSTEH